MPKIYAQDCEYWDTTVPLKRSLSQIHELLMERCQQVGMEMIQDGELPIVRIMFGIDNVMYRVDFRCLPSRMARSRSSIPAIRVKQANQLGRIAIWWLKSALLMYSYGYTETVAPYALLPAKTTDGRGVATTIQQQGIEWMLEQGNQNKLLCLPAPGETSQ
jgi:hypothetical protein